MPAPKVIARNIRRKSSARHTPNLRRKSVSRFAEPENPWQEAYCNLEHQLRTLRIAAGHEANGIGQAPDRAATREQAYATACRIAERFRAEAVALAGVAA